MLRRAARGPGGVRWLLSAASARLGPGLAQTALKSLTKRIARVRRDGAEAQIPAEQVVIGDLVLLSAGDDVAADGRIISASSLDIDESALTGESTPASKTTEPLADADLGPGDQTNMAFMNTPVTHGSGVMLVTAVGADAQVGKIAGMLATTAKQQTPLTKQLNTLTLWIGAAALVTMIVMFALGLSRGQPAEALFITAIALAIAAIPTALPTVLQVILSAGAKQLAGENAIVKELVSVETLGSTSAINSDKTGTLTMNQMTVVEVLDPVDRYTISGIGYGLEGKVHHAVGASPSIDEAVLPFIIASDAKLEDGKVVGDPTEGALLVLCAKAGMDIAASREKFPRLATLPFDPTYKLMATFNSVTDSSGAKVVRCFVKGAAPAVMGRAATALAAGASVPWDAKLNKRAEDALTRMEGEGHRVMAAAFRDLDPATFDAAGDLLGYVTDLELTSLVAMVDPPRDESKAAVLNAQNAHIRVRMVTGDDVITGAAIAKQLGIPGSAMLGTEFAALSEQERLARIDDIGVVGRVAPEHKVLLVETLRKKGDVVAMTGDGVNDAPAIKAADIGIAMGSGTQVAKNASRMILSDDNFATIMRAVEQGRMVFDNLNKFIRFVIIELVAYILTFLGASVLNIAAGQPFSPSQILYINFLVNAPLGVALGMDKEAPGLMTVKPRSRDATIMTKGLLTTAGLVGLFMAVCTLVLISYGTTHFGSPGIGSSMGVTAFSLLIVAAAFQARSVTATALTVDTFDNRNLNWTGLAELVLAVLITQLEVFRRLFGTVDLTLDQWALSLLPAVLLVFVWELGKLIARRATDRSQEATVA